MNAPVVLTDLMLNCRRHNCKEYWTSKTCGCCGKLNKALKGSSVFRCISEKCGFVADRDLNGARNILLRQM